MLQRKLRLRGKLPASTFIRVKYLFFPIPGRSPERLLGGPVRFSNGHKPGPRGTYADYNMPAVIMANFHYQALRHIRSSLFCLIRAVGIY